jgi:hypothetical protein
VKEALADVDWPKLMSHLTRLTSRSTRLLSFASKFSAIGWIAKYPRKSFEDRREKFFSELAKYARQRLGARASEKFVGACANETH